jgi:hypothetical protein
LEIDCKNFEKNFVIGVGKFCNEGKGGGKSYKHLSGKLSCFERETLQSTTEWGISEDIREFFS